MPSTAGKLQYIPRGYFRGINLGPGNRLGGRDWLLSNISSTFFLEWNPIDAEDYNKNDFVQECCCCDKVGLVQTVKLEAHSDYDPLLGLMSHDWEIDQMIPYPNGNALAYPCRNPASIADMNDRPGFDNFVFQLKN